VSLGYRILTSAAKTTDRRYFDCAGRELTEQEAIREAAITGCLLTSYTIRAKPEQGDGR
jgi:hypothetical protein